MAGPDGNQLVVVALPSDRDPVQEYSSEKEPHLTLLNLGKTDLDEADLVHVTDYIEHATSEFHNFALDVDKRGELGVNRADVLFFKAKWTKSVSAFRDLLLQDPLIFKMYHSTEQFPEWTPHLTMGYPETPAKKDTRDYPGFSYVSFDRIALWIDDSTGPTYPLKSHDDYGMEVAMSLIKQGGPPVRMSDLAHSGVKGMKWGVRRSDSGSASPRKVAKADAKFEKKASSSNTTFAVYNAAASHVNKHDVDRINNKAKYKGQDLEKPSKLRDQYYKEHENAMLSALKNSAKDLGTNASGTKQYGISVDKDGGWDVRVEDVKHASASVIKVTPVFDDRGFIISFSVSDSSMEHSGVKGMKWGVRKSDSGGGGSASSGGSADHKTAISSQNKINSSGTKSLSNQELQGLITRMGLEKQYSSMAVQQKSDMDRGMQGVQKALKVGRTVEDVRKFMGTPTGKAVKTGLTAAFASAAGFATGGPAGAAAAGASVVVRRTADHYTNGPR